MPPKYVLTYFNIKGRGEVLRWLFAIGGIKYEDRRIEPETWATLKPSLVGKTPLDDARVDAVADTIVDSVDLVVNFWVANNESEAKGNELKAKYVNQQLPNSLKCLENLASDSGYFVGNKMTWADVSLAQFPEWLAFGNVKSNVDGFAKLSKIKANVLSNPKLKEWLKKRPDTV